MEADPGTRPLTKKIIKNVNTRKEKQACCGKPIFGKFFPTVWLRRPLQINNGVDRVLLDSGYNFLLYFGCFFWALFLLLRH